MSLYTKARKHIDMNRVKELREEEIKIQKIAEVRKQQEGILAELKRMEIKEDLKYSNWRRDLENLNEGMTTSGLGMINYPAVGDVNLGTAISNFTLSGPGIGESGYNAVTTNVSGDRTKFDTMVVTISTTSLNWVIEPGHVIIGLAEGGPGTHTIVIPRTYSSLYFSASKDGTFTASVKYQRRAPVNVFVSLDDPEANSFIRGGLGGSEERKQQLKDMLEAGNELMIRMGLEPSKTSPGDIELAQGLPYTDEDDAFDDPYYKGPPPDLDDDSDFDPNDFEYAGNQGPSTPVKQYDGKFMPNPGGGRPGKIRLKGKAKLA